MSSRATRPSFEPRREPGQRQGQRKVEDACQGKELEGLEVVLLDAVRRGQELADTHGGNQRRVSKESTENAGEQRHRYQESLWHDDVQSCLHVREAQGA